VTTLDQPNPCLDQIHGRIQSIVTERGLRRCINYIEGMPRVIHNVKEGKSCYQYEVVVPHPFTRDYSPNYHVRATSICKIHRTRRANRISTAAQPVVYM
jgi:hypothetical protein